MTGSNYRWLESIRLAPVADDSGRVIISNDAGPVARTSARVADVLTHAIRAYPDIDADLIAQSVGGTAEAIITVLASVGALPALDGSLPNSTNRRLQFRKPFALQLTLLDPSRVLRLIPWLPALARTRGWWWASGALSATGLVFLLIFIVTPDSSLHQPLSVPQYGAVLAALFLSVFIHEFAHATVLAAQGGTSKRLGVMIFYLAPAFFCDVSDAWRLPPIARVKVALAGIVAQCTVASVAMIIAAFMQGTTGTACVVFGVMSYIFALFNLIPFVKLDGYIALIGYLDRPNLRADAMVAFRRRMASLLLGTGRPKGRPESFGFLLFGALCVLFPVVLVGGFALTVNSYLSSWGPIGAWITLGAFVIVIAIGAMQIKRILGQLRRSGVGRIRSALVFGSAIAAVMMLAGILPLPVTVSGGVFTVHGDAAFVLVGATVGIEKGAVLSVYPSTAFPSTQLGEVDVTGGPSPCNVPLEAVTPLTGTGLHADGQCYPVTELHARPRTTIALLRASSATLVQQLIFLASRLHG